MTIEELEFKAEFFHDVKTAQLKRQGQHYIDFHNNPMVSPPPLRDDGKTRCNQCNLLMAPYSQVPEDVKHSSREIVLNIIRADDAWRNRG